MSAEILHLDHIGVSVSDLERSLAFYRDFLGMPELERTTTSSGTTLVFLRMGNAGLVELIYRPGNALSQQKAAGPRIGHACLHINSMDAWLEKLAAHQIPLTSGPSEITFPSGKVRLCFFADPDGIPVELYERQHEV